MRINKILLIQRGNKECIDDYTRQLNYLLQSFTKMIGEEKGHIDQTKGKIIDLYGLIRNCMKCNRDNITNQRAIVKDLAKHINNNKNLNH